MNYDVFNGDADGICALVQLRLANPVNATLITGVKRDIGLLKRVDAGAGDRIVALDVSMEKNRPALMTLLERGAEVLYVDHHQAGDIPAHANLTSLIDTDANVCTSLLVDGYLGHRYTAWAVTAAFGDNLEHSALKAAKSLDLTAKQLEQLQQLGVCINYNAYGETVEDLHFMPDKLYRLLSAYVSPFEFVAERNDVFQQLQMGYRQDMSLAEQTPAEYSTDNVAVFILPDQKWARRVSGVWSNELANRFPDRAHAVLTLNALETYTVSVRAPLNNKAGADAVCARFPSGGGRKAAAGINQLPVNQVTEFVTVLSAQYAV